VDATSPELRSPYRKGTSGRGISLLFPLEVRAFEGRDIISLVDDDEMHVQNKVQLETSKAIVSSLFSDTYSNSFNPNHDKADDLAFR
jgi:hypothetical protein